MKEDNKKLEETNYNKQNLLTSSTEIQVQQNQCDEISQSRNS